MAKFKKHTITRTSKTGETFERVFDVQINNDTTMDVFS